MTHNIAKNAVERTSKALLGKVFPGLGKVAGEAAGAIFSAGVRIGSALVTDLATALDGDGTSRKGRQEKVSGWLARPASARRYAPPTRRAEAEARRLLKTMRDSLGKIVESFRPFVANVRELLCMERTRFVPGRPRRRKPPDLTALLPGFET